MPVQIKFKDIIINGKATCKALLSIFAIVVLFFSCKSADNDMGDAVARVYDKYLFLSEIEEILPDGISKDDSILIVQEYIDNWIRQQLLIRQAEKNLNKNQKDFAKQLEEYKNSLIVFEYESQLVKQKLDTTVTDKEIEDYYEQNKSDFELKENIVKVVYVKIPKNVPATLPHTLIRSDKPQDKNKLQDFCHKYATNYYLEDQNWLLFNDILKEIPINTYNQEEYLKNNRLIEIQDSSYTYLMNIKGFMIKESISPISFEANNIRDIIINKRKLELIDNMKNDIYENALRNGDFELLKKN
ncbi:MAG: hypothetical protein PHR81_00875 [Bacteroidales bacterium]|jgi:hypothetical protein|nr:hypothetical protein [Bacteroidales bacterium]MDD4213342.1 hypothetical protein [Bacteroidales bacterium]